MLKNNFLKCTSCNYSFILCSDCQRVERYFVPNDQQPDDFTSSLKKFTERKSGKQILLFVVVLTI